jgi:hypothetical protein
MAGVSAPCARATVGAVIVAYEMPALPPAGCDGLEISRVEIRSYPPSATTAAERAASTTAEAVGLEHRRTQPFVLRAYVLLKPGEQCSEQARAESERMLRAQPFVASAAVRTFPDGDGKVRVRVDVVDEAPLLAGARFANGGVRGVQVGTRNLRGRGLMLVAGGERAEAYRPGARLVVGQFGMFGRPAFADLELHRRRVGGLLRVAIAEPFLTNGQKRAFHADVAQESYYGDLVRPSSDDAASLTRRTAYSAGFLRRVGGRDAPGGRVGLVGVMLIGTDVRASDAVVVLSDSGIVNDADSELLGRYPNHAAGRLAVTLGGRALRFKSVRRFEALRAVQDVGEGVEMSVILGPSIGLPGRSRDQLLATDIYLGTGGATSFASLRVRAEGRRIPGQNAWEGVVASGQLSWHRLSSDTRTRTLTVQGARVDGMSFPIQLTMRDPHGGLMGFPDSREAGGRRITARLEERALLPWRRDRAALAVGAFADAGRLWAGDVPYGRDSPVRASAGFSLFAAVPSEGKRLFRVDFAAPLNPEPGRARWAIRFSSADRTGSFWTEPHDVARARAGNGTATLVRW